jgi:hypothetical protein
VAFSTGTGQADSTGAVMEIDLNSSGMMTIDHKGNGHAGALIERNKDLQLRSKFGGR